MENPPRRSANYHPSIWGEYFLAFASFDDADDDKVISFIISEEEKNQLEQLKEEVRKIVIETPNNSLEKLEFISALQRLGVSYHFENEIEESLLNIYDQNKSKLDENDDDDEDLYTVALRFRLLRQQGQPLCLLCLYEAAHFRVDGENILEEALIFTTNALESTVSKLGNFFAKQVDEALKMPIHKTLTRLGARLYMPIYQQNESHNEVFLKWCKLDFNSLQKLHRRELSGLTKWWKNLDFATKLPFARDRLVECYFWMLGVYFEPQYYLARKISTKVIAMASIIDDIYDVHGTLDKLILLTDAISSINLSSILWNLDRWAATSLVGMGGLVKEEGLVWLTKRPLIAEAAATIARLMDDMAGHELEKKRGDVASAAECYMNQYGTSKEEAFQELQKQVTNAWKDINKECLKPIAVPMPLLHPNANLARGDEDPNTFEEFLEPEEYIDLGHLFTTDRIFSSKDELVDWAK
ncbi:hypothetical protein M9H77_13498 [Catharanthus roseus]|uniref:Uncharacterized protein n=1 Tax=Catharanthus roseus TaxID=4058 RepID=A0ACC0BKN4_CATRO|nr:hypothetical protein M9H77_13498 [Catharanthus roseus]